MADNTLDVYLAEYGTLREELLGRIQAITTLTSSLYVALFALISAISFLSFKDHSSDFIKMNIHDVIVYVPLIATPLSLLWLEHVLMIHRIGRYLHFKLRPLVTCYLTDKSPTTPCMEVMGWGSSEPILPVGLNRLFSTVYVGLGGAFLFLALIPACTILIGLNEGWRMWWHPRILFLDAIASILLLIFVVSYMVETEQYPRELSPAYWRERGSSKTAV